MVVEKIKTHLLVSVIFFPPRKSRLLWDQVKTNGKAGQATIWKYSTAHGAFVGRVAQSV
jgi:hypothetical protein